jgi:hypothetical protein
MSEKDPTYNERLANWISGTIQNSGTFSASVIESNLILFDRFEQERLNKIEAQRQAEADEADALIRKQYKEHRAYLHRYLPKGVVLSECEEHGPWQIVLTGYGDGWYIVKTDAQKANKFVKVASYSRKGGLARAILECRRRNFKIGYEQKLKELEVPVRS